MVLDFLMVGAVLIGCFVFVGAIVVGACFQGLVCRGCCVCGFGCGGFGGFLVSCWVSGFMVWVSDFV